MKTICFYGIDGCGKTTQAEILSRTIQANNKEAILIHILSKESTVSSKMQESFLVSKIVKVIRNLKDNFLGAMVKITLRIFNVLCDSRVTVIRNNRKYKGKIILYDRYFYDILVILASSYPKTSNFIINFARLIPRPDIVIFCDISPCVAIKRKPGHTLREAEKYCELYRKLSKKISSSIINTEIGKEEIAGKIKELCSEIFL